MGVCALVGGCERCGRELFAMLVKRGDKWVGMIEDRAVLLPAVISGSILARWFMPRRKT